MSNMSIYEISVQMLCNIFIMLSHYVFSALEEKEYILCFIESHTETVFWLVMA